ncbi:PepSY-like domain-containing protein [Methylomicrobium sp. RS1]|uniref:PepSY-like domain-containing protein n=1 Tax=Candidatus Methylomicrobium oryzae TaxID=2802053 RepID=UPI00192229EA|nr:PepSY-like domain-containing protein [Methylomicrobium sp. RS1]MBL1265827.1 PepSY-like domain-containing protein [Methylomicrobium sp. RS1]
MKTEAWVIAAMAASWMVFGQVNAEEKALHKSQVPKAVLDAFEKAYPNMKDVEFEEEMFNGNAAYEVEFKTNHKEHEVLYSANGTLLQKEEEIEAEALPESVADAIRKAYPKAKIKEVEKILKPDDTMTGYEVEIVTAGKEIELELDTQGKILRKEKE